MVQLQDGKYSNVVGIDVTISYEIEAADITEAQLEDISEGARMILARAQEGILGLVNLETYDSETNVELYNTQETMAHRFVGDMNGRMQEWLKTNDVTGKTLTEAARLFAEHMLS